MRRALGLWRLRHDTVRQPAIGQIVDREPRLQAGEAWRCLREPLRRQAELRRLRNVFSIENRDEFAAQQRQGDVQRSRLGSRLASRSYDNLVAGRRDVLLQRGMSLGVVFFDHEFDVELCARIVAVLGSKLT